MKGFLAAHTITMDHRHAKNDGGLEKSIVTLITGVLLLMFASLTFATGQSFNLHVDLLTTQVGEGVVQQEAYMSASVLRDDQSTGSYKVPLTIVFPEDPASCNGAALSDTPNSVFYETFPFAGGPDDPFFPSLLPLGLMTLGADYILGRGFVYANVQWNKLVLDRQRSAGTLPDPSLHIDKGTDGYIILRDLSLFLRSPGAFTSGPAPCNADDVLAFGYSQTGMLLRGFYFDGLNTGLADDEAFDDGRIYEGSLHALPGSHCREMTDVDDLFSYTFQGCGGETPSDQGKVITVNTETDLQLLEGWKARPEIATDHYRLYEIAASAHIPTTLFPLKLLGLRTSDANDQNFADTSFVLRAMMDHLNGWARESSLPPEDAFIQGNVGRLDEPLFSSHSWGSDGKSVFLTKRGEDGNAVGGVRLPHVRTNVDGQVDVGAPIGNAAGVECGGDISDKDYLLSCGIAGDFSIYNMAGGVFVPYTLTDSDLCDSYYDSVDSYQAAATEAAELAQDSGWILEEDAAALVGNAMDRLGTYPGCVPE